MAKSLTYLVGNEAGPSPLAFRVVCQYWLLEEDVTKGYHLQVRFYVEVTSGQSSNFTSNCQTSWGTTTALSTAGAYAVVDVDKGWYMYGETCDCGTQEAYYTGGSGTVYKSTVSTAYTVPNPTITHTCKTFAFGFKNNEGGYEYNSSAKLLSEFTFTKNYGDSITYIDGDHGTIPNGYYLNDSFGLWDTNDGTISYHTIPYTITSPAYQLGAEFYTYPYDYNITYELNGGTNNSSNPSTYNILYGVEFQEPSRKNYIFEGWYINDVKVDGINVGANATFSTAEEFYNSLSTRTTGDIIVTAKWKPTYNCYFCPESEYKKTLLWINYNGTWVVPIIWKNVDNTWTKNSV